MFTSRHVNRALTLLTLCLAFAGLAFSLPARAADTITFDNLPHEPGVTSSSTFAAANGGSTYDGVTFDTTSLVFGDQSRLGTVHSPHYALTEAIGGYQLTDSYPIALTTTKTLTSFYFAPGRNFQGGYVVALRGSNPSSSVFLSSGSTPQFIRTGFEKLTGITGYTFYAYGPGDNYPAATLAVDDLTFAASYEAESGTLAGGAVAFNDTAASNGQAVGNLWMPGASDTLTNVDGGTGGKHNLVITYGVSGSAVHDIAINGVDLGPIFFPGTGGYTGSSYNTLTVPITLNPGTTNTVQLYTTRADAVASGYNGIVADKFTVVPPVAPVTVEAETGTLNGGAVVYSDFFASGGAVVGGMQNDGADDRVFFDAAPPGSYDLIIRYACAGDSVKTLNIDGVTTQIRFPNTGAWVGQGAYKTISIPITLDYFRNIDVSNVLRLGDFNGVNLDSFTLVPRTSALTAYEAESGTLAGGAVAFYDPTASNGLAVGNLWMPGASDTLTNVDGGTGGKHNLVITYGVSGSAVHDIAVNGVDLGPVTFPNTGGYTGAYKTLTVPITLNPGSYNTIELYTTNADAVASGYNGIVADKFTIQ